MILSELKATENSRLVKAIAAKHGIDFCGISKATFLVEQAPILEEWLKNKKNGEMAYMENHFDKRLDPRLLVPGAKSVISFLINYFPKPEVEKHFNTLPFKISKYAYGNDYHEVIKEKLTGFVAEIRDQLGAVEGRLFVDSAPVMDKVLAEKSGLGWMGKHTNLIHKQAGSYFFIAEWICDLDLTEDAPVKDYCGTCTRCIDACPTDAITRPYEVDGSKCISYLTIELKSEIPDEFKGKSEGWVFGCDICQDVCPWNRFSKPATHQWFTPTEEILSLSSNQWQELTEEVFSRVFKKSAIKRAKLKGLKRNLNFGSLQSP